MSIPFVDHSLTYSHVQYYWFAVPSLLTSLVFNILPPLLLILYLIEAFRSCLSKCCLNFITINIFIEKIHGWYRSGLDGGWDMRSFSGLYFLLQLLACIAKTFAKARDLFQPQFLSGVLFSIIIALAKPYKKTYMMCLDTLILLNLAVQCFILSSKEPQIFPILQILILIQISILLMWSNYQNKAQKRHNNVTNNRANSQWQLQLIIHLQYSHWFNQLSTVLSYSTMHAMNIE